MIVKKKSVKEKEVKEKKAEKEKRKKALPRKKPKYKFVGGKRLIEILREHLPKELIPTEKIGPIVGGIFVLILIVAAFQFPFSSMMSGNTDIQIRIGIPLIFLEFDLANPEEPPLRSKELFLDVIIYIIIAYIIDVFLNFILKNPLLFFNKEKDLRPKVFKDIKPRSRSETLTEKMFAKAHPAEKIQKEPPPNKKNKGKPLAVKVAEITTGEKIEEIKPSQEKTIKKFN